MGRISSNGGLQVINSGPIGRELLLGYFMIGWKSNARSLFVSEA